MLLLDVCSMIARCLLDRVSEVLRSRSRGYHTPGRVAIVWLLPYLDGWLSADR